VVEWLCVRHRWKAKYCPLVQIVRCRHLFERPRLVGQNDSMRALAHLVLSAIDHGGNQLTEDKGCPFSRKFATSTAALLRAGGAAAAVWSVCVCHLEPRGVISSRHRCRCHLLVGPPSTNLPCNNHVFISPLPFTETAPRSSKGVAPTELLVRSLGHLDAAREAMGFHPARRVDRIAPEVVDELAHADHASDCGSGIDPGSKHLPR
jgi:hypothetical protein